MLTVSIIVHGDFSHIEAALHSIAQQSVPCQVHLTVNTGPHPEVDRLQALFPELCVHINEAPLGFAANHNRVLRLARTPYVALLNDDILLYPGALEALTGYLDAHPDVAVVGPAIENPDGSPQIAVWSDPTLPRMIYRISGLSALTPPGGRVRRALQRPGIARLLGVESLNLAPVTRPVPVVIGVAMVARREACARAGVMDEDTRVYGEEFGWQWRLRQRGWRVVFVAEARVIHYNPANDLTGWRLAEHRKGIICYFQKYRSPWQAVVLRGSVVGFHGLGALLLAPFNREKARAHWKAVQVGLRPGCLPPEEVL